MTDSPETLERAVRVECLQTVREIGRIALSAISRSTQVIDGPGVLEKIARLNAALVRDDVVEQTLATSDLNEFAKLFTIATRVAQVGAEIESDDLPDGWSVRETLLERSYSHRSARVAVTVNKDDPDHGRLDIRLYGQRVWSGYEGEGPGYVSVSDAFGKAERLLKDPALGSKALDEYAVLRLRHTDTPTARTNQAFRVLRDIRAHQARLDAHKLAPSGDDYKVMLNLALEALRTLEISLPPDDPRELGPQTDNAPPALLRTSALVGSLREVALAWQTSANLFRNFLPGKRMMVLAENGLAFTEQVNGSAPRFKFETPYPGLIGICLMSRQRAVAVQSQLAAHAPELGPFVLTDAFKYAERKVRGVSELLEQLEPMDGPRLTLNAPTALSASILPPDGASGGVAGDMPSRPLQMPAMDGRLVAALHRAAGWLENALEAQPEDINPSEIAPVLDDVRDALSAAEVRWFGINPAILTPPDETITFRAWHDEDAPRGLAPERAKVELEISGFAGSQRTQHIEQARMALRELFGTLWDVPATVFTEQELAEATSATRSLEP